MPRQLTSYRVFVASPGGLEPERRAVRELLHEYNESEAVHRGVLFDPIGWELTLGGVGRPQEQINEDLRECDYFVLLLWNRWGSTPHTGELTYTSGTEEEFHEAVKCYHDPGRFMREIVPCFKHVDPQERSEADEQLARVLAFQTRLEEEKAFLYHTFDVVDALKGVLRRHLAQWLRDHESGRAVKGKARPAPPPPAAAWSPLPRAAGAPGKSFLAAEGERLAAAGRRADAEAVFARAVVQGRDADAVLAYGEFLYRDGRVAQAEVMLERAREMAEAAGNRRVLAGALQALGNLCQGKGDLAGAESRFAKSVQAAREADHRDLLAAGLRNLAELHALRADFPGAERLLDESLALEEALGDERGRAATLRAQGVLAWMRGRYEAAEGLYGRALEILRKLDDRLETARVCFDLGRALQAQQRIEEAEAAFREGLALSRALNFLEGCARGHANLGNVYTARGDFDRAERVYRRALRESEVLGRVVGVAAGYNNLGIVSHARGDLRAAERMYRRSIAANEAQGSLAEAVRGYMNLGLLYQETRALDRAEETYRKALKLIERLGDAHQEAHAYFGLGAVALLRGSGAEADAWFTKAESYHSPMTDRLLRELREGPSAGAGGGAGPKLAERAMAQLREALAKTQP